MKLYEANNNTLNSFIGIKEQGGIFTAMTTTKSKEYKTFSGAVKFFNGSRYDGQIPTTPTEIH